MPMSFGVALNMDHVALSDLQYMQITEIVIWIVTLLCTKICYMNGLLSL